MLSELPCDALQALYIEYTDATFETKKVRSHEACLRALLHIAAVALSGSCQHADTIRFTAILDC